MNAWGGVSALGLGLQVLWTGASARGWSLGRVRDLTTRNTAKQVRLWPQKGRLAAGSDADLCIFDPDALWTVSENDLYFKNKVSPYVGRQLRGRVEESWLAGQQVWQRHGRTWSSSPRGRLLLNDAI
ncbi:Allantoinase [Savitreella phatthalungensis]